MDPVKEADKKRLTMGNMWNDFDGAQILASIYRYKETLSNAHPKSVLVVHRVGKSVKIPPLAARYLGLDNPTMQIKLL
jgi:hypothetical protein